MLEAKFDEREANKLIVDISRDKIGILCSRTFMFDPIEGTMKGKPFFLRYQSNDISNHAIYHSDIFSTLLILPQHLEKEFYKLLSSERQQIEARYIRESPFSMPLIFRKIEERSQDDNPAAWQEISSSKYTAWSSRLKQN